MKVIRSKSNTSFIDYPNQNTHAEQFSGMASSKTMSKDEAKKIALENLSLQELLQLLQKKANSNPSPQSTKAKIAGQQKQPSQANTAGQQQQAAQASNTGQESSDDYDDGDY